MPTVVVIDDDSSVRRALQRLLIAASYQVQAFASAESYLAAASRVEADCMLLDIDMPGIDGLSLQESLLRADETPPIVFLTGLADVPMTVRAMKHGAQDLLQKPVDERDLLQAIAVAVARNLERKVERARRASIDGLLGTLTPRENEVLRHVVTGKLNKQIAGDLDISEKTVKVHRGRVMAKLEVRSVAELVRLAERAGIELE